MWKRNFTCVFLLWSVVAVCFPLLFCIICEWVFACAYISYWAHFVRFSKSQWFFSHFRHHIIIPNADELDTDKVEFEGMEGGSDKAQIRMESVRVAMFLANLSHRNKNDNAGDCARWIVGFCSSSVYLLLILNCIFVHFLSCFCCCRLDSMFHQPNVT